MAETPSLVVIGDVHKVWRPEDSTFLENGDQDVALFVGDLGDEDVDIVQTIAELAVPKRVILGNHDAWRSFSEKRITDNLRLSLSRLGTDHLAYDVFEWYQAGVSIVGARPFSWGGMSLRSPEVYRELYGVTSHEESADRIVDAARRAQHRDIVILAHNGPAGLSFETHDIWGKDFGKSPRGDWGDEDLELAIDRIKSAGLRVPLVIAGHMHHKLITPRGALRTRFLRAYGTIYMNAAVVPRTKQIANGTILSYFVRVFFSAGKLQGFEEIWVDPSCRIREQSRPRVMEEVG
ncbi:MAG: TIGR04168 family protein [Planctomycetes bacterium]|nr:TIGR04168 family protein [Planctomycetota bacterium]MCB9870707.1 TIGR04168 family protein [Planctomycetota bacterium]MCB9889043.1 TIGR04168 family protein [Planctomycetota bacterium]